MIQIFSLNDSISFSATSVSVLGKPYSSYTSPVTWKENPSPKAAIRGTISPFLLDRLYSWDLWVRLQPVKDFIFIRIWYFDFFPQMANDFIHQQKDRCSVFFSQIKASNGQDHRLPVPRKDTGKWWDDHRVCPILPA
jgi:hypothetical protein